MMNKRMLSLLLAIALLIGVPLAGTLAFLMDKSETITNTFQLGEITYSLTLNGNKPGDATSDIEMPKVTPDSPTKVSAGHVDFTLDKAPTLQGYKFLGWYAAEDGDTQVVGPDAKTIEVGYGDPYTVTEGDEVSLTLYAHWERMDFTVSFDTQVDDVQNPDSMTVTYLEPYGKHGDLPSPVRTGYTFAGWYLDQAGTTPSDAVTEDSIVELAQDHTLYAQWAAKSYVIRYHANGGSGTMADQVIKYGTLVELKKNMFTKSDYTFGGWARSADGEVQYLDQQPVLNLEESGTIDLYAVWLQNSHTVKFDYNGGFGTPESKQFQNGKAYGQLPEYPMHNPVKQGENKWLNYLFTGWYTEKNGGTRVYSTTIANSIEDHTLYAHWEEAPSNNVIQNMQVYNNPDDDFNGIVDDVHLKFTCTSTFEKFNIPIKGLIPGQTYQITYNASNTASFGDYVNGYKNSVYGSYIVEKSELTGGRIDTSGELGEDYFGMDLLATWYDREVPSGNLDINDTATNDEYLQGPWNNRSITFTATKETMYWTWDFGLMQDNVEYEYSITDINIEPVAPTIQFANKKMILANGSTAKVTDDNASEYTNEFVFTGAGYAETMYFPITGLNKGSTYTITFNHKISGAGLISSGASYDYGCGISSVEPTALNSRMDDLGANWISQKPVPVFTKVNTNESVTFTFTATSDTAYWVWNMADCKDNQSNTIEIKITNFSVKHTGGNITYHSSSDKATLEWMPGEVILQEIILDWEGIDDTNMDSWYPVGEQSPVAGDSYELAFEPMEGYTMAEVITVTIDDVTYEVYTDGRTAEGKVAPFYDPESNILTIPRELLPHETKTVAIKASAVRVVAVVPTEPTEEPTAPTEPEVTAPTDPTEGSEPTDSTDPTEGSEPTDPTDPTEGSEPTDPTDPTEGSEPTDPTDPTEGSEPTDPTDPTEGTDPTAPSLCTEPSGETEPAGTTEVTDPTEPAEDDAEETEEVAE